MRDNIGEGLYENSFGNRSHPKHRPCYRPAVCTGGMDYNHYQRDTEAARAAVVALAKEFPVTVQAYGMPLDNVESIKDAFYQVKRDFGKLHAFCQSFCTLPMTNTNLLSKSEYGCL